MSDPINTFFSVKNLFKSVTTEQFLLGELSDEPSLVENGDHWDDRFEPGCKLIQYDYIMGPLAISGLVSMDNISPKLIEGSTYQHNERIILRVKNTYMSCFHVTPQILINSHCNPAAYGDVETQTTVINPDVRTAYSCDDIQILSPVCEHQNGNIILKEYVDHELLEEIKYACLRNFFIGYGNISLVPHKLNIYGPGGFFKSHKDTPCNPEKPIGTIVIMLPNDHQGGDLVIEDRGLKCVFKSDELEENTLRWVVFYGDYAHSVKPVTSGYRVTITYNIYIDSADNESTYNDEKYLNGHPDESQNVKLNLCAILRSLSVLSCNSQAGAGILLTHEYPIDNLQTGLLKSSDASLYQMLQKYYECRLVSVLIETKEYWGYEGSEPANATEGNVYICTNEMWHYYRQHNTLKGYEAPKEKYYFFIEPSSYGQLINQHLRDAYYFGNRHPLNADGRDYRLYFGTRAVT